MVVELNKIYCEDCIEFLNKLDDNSLDCIITSPPYNFGKDYTEYEILGQTRDDAAGEAFDKISRALELGYPGGPVIDRMAKEGNPHAIQFPKVHFNDSLDFSFSGVKTAVINYIHNAEQKGIEINKADVAASFQNVIKANDIGFYVGTGIGNGIPDTGLGSQVHHHIEFIFCKALLDEAFIGNIALDKGPGRLRVLGSQLFNFFDTGFN